MAEKEFLVSLGHSVGRIKVYGFETDPNLQNVLELTAPAYQSGSGFFPAASFKIFGRKDLIKLRDALIDALGPKQEG